MKTNKTTKEERMLFVLDCVNKALTRAEIIQAIQHRYGLKKRRAREIYEEGLRFIDQVAVSNVKEYKNVLLERLEAQYRETYQIEDPAKRLRVQMDIVDKMAKISGVTQTTVQQVNIFEHFPEQKTIEIKGGNVLEMRAQKLSANTEPIHVLEADINDSPTSCDNHNE